MLTKRDTYRVSITKANYFRYIRYLTSTSNDTKTATSPRAYEDPDPVARYLLITTSIGLSVKGPYYRGHAPKAPIL